MKHTLRAALAALLVVLLMLGAMGCSEKSPPAADPPPSTETGTPTPPATEVTPPAPTPEAPAPKGPEPCDIISRTGTLWTPMTEVFKIHSYTDVNSVHCRVVQGGCTDGTYYYVALNDGQSSNAASISAVRKYELATGKLLATFEGLQIAHCNDITYNPDTGELLMVHNTPERWLISVFDGDSLEFKRKIDLGNLEIYSLAYDRDEQCYWAGLSYGFNFVKLDLSFTQVGSVYVGMETGYTKQGMDVDSKYIYFCQYNKNSVIVYDKQGNYIKEILLPVTSYEAENICHVGNTFYIGYYKSSAGGMVYRTDLRISEDTSVSMTELATLNRYTDSGGNLYKVAQGSCTDGEHIYLAMNNDISSGYRTVIYKIDPQTGAVLNTVEGFTTGLTNDMTYNSKTDRILIAHNTPEATKFSVYEADTLEHVETVTLSYNIYCIAYDPVRDGYWVGLSGTYDLAFLDADLNRTVYSGYNTGCTKQGLDCDGTYVYAVHSAANTLVIYKTDGTPVGVCALPVSTNSAQSICHIGNAFYIGYNVSDAGGILYTATVTVK